MTPRPQNEKTVKADPAEILNKVTQELINGGVNPIYLVGALDIVKTELSNSIIKSGKG